MTGVGREKRKARKLKRVAIMRSVPHLGHLSRNMHLRLLLTGVTAQASAGFFSSVISGQACYQVNSEAEKPDLGRYEFCCRVRPHSTLIEPYPGLFAELLASIICKKYRLQFSLSCGLCCTWSARLSVENCALLWYYFVVKGLRR